MPRVPPSIRRHATTTRTLLDAFAPYLLVLTAAAVVFVTATALFPYHSANHDEAVYLQQAAMLLDGTLTLQPPVEDAFRPWFFVEDGDTLYPKYAPVPAAIYAIGLAFGLPRIVLALVGASIVGLTYLIGVELFDRRTGLLAGALLLTSPMFVLDTATFLPYAPTTALNLGFAYAYLRAERPGPSPVGRSPSSASRRRWAALAGALAGLAFFARPYTAVLFATPFVLHALWSLARATRDDEPGDEAGPLTSRRAVIDRRLTTAIFGLTGVVTALAYNWTLTGDPLLFPYEAFAPLDGLGFGRREILGHGVQYTPELALRVNATVLATYLTQWAPLGIVGGVLAVLGLLTARRGWDWRRAVVAGVFATVALGNVYFWGNYNLLGNLDAPGDGLVAILGPYYHFDLLLPTALFAAHGAITASEWLASHTGGWVDSRRSSALLATILVVAFLGAGVATEAAFDDPVQRNAGVTGEYDSAYAPFTSEGGPPEDAVVFLPEPYGPWLNHPFQVLRNDPEFQGSTIYALQTNRFAVVDAYPERDYYRYAYRGTWYPFDGSSVTPTLQPVAVASGETVTATFDLELPGGASSTSMRLETPSGHAFFAAPAEGRTQTVHLHVNQSAAWLTGPGIEPTASGQIPVNETDEVVLEVNVNTETGGFTYHAILPVSTANGERRALTPEVEVCTVSRLCGGESASIPGPGGSPYEVDVTMNGS